MNALFVSEPTWSFELDLYCSSVGIWRVASVTVVVDCSELYADETRGAWKHLHRAAIVFAKLVWSNS